MNFDISVIIPMYNAENFIAECLKSVQNQSMANIEIVCIDDCSTDNTNKRAKEFANKDSRIRVITHNNNRELSASRNTGIIHANGEYIFFIDSDDFLPNSHALEHLFSCAKATGSNEVIGRTIQWFQDDNVYTDGYHSTYQLKNIFQFQILQHPEFIDNCIACNKLLNKEFIIKNRIFFDEELFKFEDNPFSCKVHALSNSISYIHEHTYVHRRRPSDVKSKCYAYNLNDAHMWYKACCSTTSVALESSNELAKIFIKKVPSFIESSFLSLKNVNANDNYYKELYKDWLEYLNSIKNIDSEIFISCKKKLMTYLTL